MWYSCARFFNIIQTSATSSATTSPFFLGRSGRLLIAAGADFNGRDNSGRTPVFYSCGQSAEVVGILAKAGADLNAKDNFGQTPLTPCVDVASVRALLSAGADPTVLSPGHLTIAQEARKLGATEKAALKEGHP
jgi:ankyrin repeat protein